MNASALFLEKPASGVEMRDLQPLPDSSEAAWDRWVIEVGGVDFLAWKSNPRHIRPVPSVDQQVKAFLADD